MLLIAGSSSAQSTMDNVLSQIATNSKTWKAEQQRIVAAQKELYTGISLYDPKVEYDYLQGFPESAGIQQEFNVYQPFDFPSSYVYRKKVANLKSSQTTYESELIRKNILLEAKLVAIELVYLNKRRFGLTQRLTNAEKFYTDYQKKFDLLDATVLDLNKAKLLNANVQTDLTLVEAEIEEQLSKLTAFNGGIAVVFNDTVYPVQPTLAEFETLEQALASSDPALKYFETQKEVGEAQIQLNKSLWLPKLEAGYRYQKILGEQFHGGHIGVTIPLWENKNIVRYQKLQTTFYDLQIQNYRNERYYEVKQLYEKYQTLKSNFEEYKNNLQSLLNVDLLNKSLTAGQITTLEYYFETSLYNDSIDRYLTLEKEYQTVLAELLKYEL